MHASFRSIYAHNHLFNLTGRFSCQYFKNPDVVLNGSTTFRSFGDVSDGDSKKKAGKVKSVWVCESCGYTNAQWRGACRSCESVGKKKRFVEAGDDGGEWKTTNWSGQHLGTDARPVRLRDVDLGVDFKDWLIPL